MSDIETIQKALNILDQHDFYYMMVDRGYDAAKESAQANMRFFVKVTNGLPENERQLLRDLWNADYERCRCYRPMWTSPDAKEKEARYEALLAEAKALVAA